MREGSVSDLIVQEIGGWQRSTRRRPRGRAPTLRGPEPQREPVNQPTPDGRKDYGKDNQPDEFRHVFQFFRAWVQQQADNNSVLGSSANGMTVRGGAEYLLDESSFEFGEYAVEYLKRFSPAWRAYVGFEGAKSELSLVTEAQWHFTESAFFKLNNAVGITSKSTDWAPEVGIVFSFPTGGLGSQLGAPAQ